VGLMAVAILIDIKMGCDDVLRDMGQYGGTDERCMDEGHRKSGRNKVEMNFETILI
jgi:hypothetical protein